MKFRKRYNNRKEPNKYIWECQYQYKLSNGKYRTFNVPKVEYQHIDLNDPVAREDFEKQYSSKTELDKLHTRKMTRKRVAIRNKKERPTGFLLDIFYESRKHMASIDNQLFDVNEILTGFCPATNNFELDLLPKRIRSLHNWLIERPGMKSIKSINNKISHFNGFLRVMYEEGKTEDLIWIPPVSLKKHPELAGRKKGIEVVISEEIEAQLRELMLPKYRLQFDAMIGLGLRANEPNRLKLADVHLNATQEDFPDLFRALNGAGVQVHGVVDVKFQLHRRTYKEAKAKTTGVVGVLSEKTQKSLAQAWLQAHEKGQECLFEHIPPLSFESNFQKAVSKLPFEYRHLTPHDLRHTFCTRAAAVVPEPFRDLLMAFTRHSNWTVCERYRHNLRLLKGKNPEVQAANIELMKVLAGKKSAS